MASVSVSIGVAVLTFGVGLLGLYLKRLLPERHMSAGSRDMIGAVIGLLSLLLALVLGTLVGSAYGFFATQKGDIESLCARSLELDLAFRQYGPETQPLRQALRDSMQEALDALRGDSAAYQRHFELGGYMSKFETWNETLSALVQIAGAGKRPVLCCRDFKLGARHSTLRAQVDLGHPDVPVRIVPCGCDASIRCRRS